MPRASAQESRSTLVYDADCGTCSRFKQLVSLLDVHSRIACLPLVQADQEGLLRAVPEDLRYRSMHLVSADGSVLSGSEAVPSLLELLPLVSVFSGFLRGTGVGRRLTGLGYASAARLRGSSCETSHAPATAPETALRAFG